MIRDRCQINSAGMTVSSTINDAPKTPGGKPWAATDTNRATPPTMHTARIVAHRQNSSGDCRPGLGLSQRPQHDNADAEPYAVEEPVLTVEIGCRLIRTRA